MGAIARYQRPSHRYGPRGFTARFFAPGCCTDLELTLYGISNYGGLVRFEQSRRCSGPLVEEQWRQARTARAGSSGRTVLTTAIQGLLKCRLRSSATASTTLPNTSKFTRRIII